MYTKNDNGITDKGMAGYQRKQKCGKNDPLELANSKLKVMQEPQLVRL